MFQPLWFYMVVFLSIPVIILLQLYGDIKHGRKIMDRSPVVGVFYFFWIYYEISTGKLSKDGLLNMIMIMGAIYMATVFMYIYVEKHYGRKERNSVEK